MTSSVFLHTCPLPLSHSSASSLARAVASVTPHHHSAASPVLGEAYFECSDTDSRCSTAFHAVERALSELGSAFSVRAGAGPNLPCARIAAEHADWDLVADYAHLPESALCSVIAKLSFSALPNATSSHALEQAADQLDGKLPTIVDVLKLHSESEALKCNFPLLARIIDTDSMSISADHLEKLEQSLPGSGSVPVLQVGARSVACADVASVTMQPVNASDESHAESMIQPLSAELVNAVICEDNDACRWPLQLAIAWKTADPNWPHTTSSDELSYNPFPQRPTRMHKWKEFPFNFIEKVTRLAVNVITEQAVGSLIQVVLSANMFVASDAFITDTPPPEIRMYYNQGTHHGQASSDTNDDVDEDCQNNLQDKQQRKRIESRPGNDKRKDIETDNTVNAEIPEAEPAAPSIRESVQQYNGRTRLKLTGLLKALGTKQISGEDAVHLLSLRMEATGAKGNTQEEVADS